MDFHQHDTYIGSEEENMNVTLVVEIFFPQMGAI
jgi:hypothetical protein